MLDVSTPLQHDFEGMYFGATSDKYIYNHKYLDSSLLEHWSGETTLDARLYACRKRVSIIKTKKIVLNVETLGL